MGVQVQDAVPAVTEHTAPLIQLVLVTKPAPRESQRSTMFPAQRVLPAVHARGTQRPPSQMLPVTQFVSTVHVVFGTHVGPVGPSTQVEPVQVLESDPRTPQELKL